MSCLNLLVLRCSDVHRTRSFYECFGFQFDEHRHGSGPIHSGATDSRGLIFELYPTSDQNPVDRCGVGFADSDLKSAANVLYGSGFAPDKIEAQPWGLTFVVRDPDGRRVEAKQY